MTYRLDLVSHFPCFNSLKTQYINLLRQVLELVSMILIQYKKLYIKITIGFCLFQEEMAPKTQVARVPILVDYTCNDLRKWYLDIHGVEGS